ncbi:MAG: hypothetical protein NTW29_19785 [Bacteroidetes bacterium]|nr:hypothetical protein [Bacteroidota bacterium]
MQNNIKFLLLSLLAVVFTFIIHEFTHWITGEGLGYAMQMTLNKAYPLEGFYRKEWHYTLISATGPFVTLLQSAVIYLLIRRTHSQLLFPFLFSSFYLELLSGIMNIRHANDLGRISASFQLGVFTLPLLVVSLHLFFLYKSIREEKYSRPFLLRTVISVLLFSSIWILANNAFHIVLL